MSNPGQKIIEGLKEALAGDFARVTIDGVTWVRAKDLLADQQEIMRINNSLRQTLIDINAMLADREVPVEKRMRNAVTAILSTVNPANA